MATPATPTNLYVQTGNAQVYLSWDLSAGATSYSVLRSADNVTFASIATVVVNNYLDTSAVVSTQYFYQVSATNSSGTSSATPSQSAITVDTGKETLGQLRLQAQQRADMVNSNQVTVPEWNSYINKAYFELYDLLTTTFEDYYLASPLTITTVSSTAQYDLPNGSNYNSAPAFYKLMGVDLGVASGYITLRKFNFIERNRNNLLNGTATAFNMTNLRYRVMGNSIMLTPTPASGQSLQIWYIPRASQLLKDTDTIDGVSGWTEYIIVRAAKMALDKQELDSSALTQEILYLKQRIEESAQGRDAGEPSTISNLRNANLDDDTGWGY